MDGTAREQPRDCNSATASNEHEVLSPEQPSETAWNEIGMGAREAPRNKLLARLRQKPSFLIIGAQKAGTTSLYSYLAQHPGMRPSTRKEIHYFDTPDYDQGEGWYLSHFPGRRPFSGLLSGLQSGLLSGKSAEFITGEASPYYLAHPGSPARAKDFAADLKLIVMLRDPISRAFSHYNHQLRKGRETLDFDAALVAEQDRIKGEREKMLADPNYYSYNYWLYSYVERGFYAKQLEHWFQYFPREQFLFIDSTDFFGDPNSVYSRTLDFLGLSQMQLASAPKKNAGSYDGMTETAQQFLEEAFRVPNQELNTLLGQTFSWSQ